MMIGLVKTTALCLAAAALSGCAAMNRFDSEVTSYSHWPADRRPASYAFERLPSQEARLQQQQMLEDAARPAIEAAGFVPAVDAKSADVTVQVGARIAQADRSPFDDPLWWGPGFHRPFPYYTRGGRVFFGPGWRYGPGSGFDYGYEREVALLIRDRRSGEPLYETSATSDGLTPMVATALPAMFRAALRDFPSASSKPHTVSVQLGP